jgi:superfamily I DNA/RNA helicase
MENQIAKHSIICIDKKTGIYNTQHVVNYGLPTDIEDKLLQSCKNKDHDIFLRAAYQEFRYFVDKNESRTVNRFKTKYNLDLDRKDFAQLCELCKLIYSEPSTYNVSSIDSVKGLEADTCVIILTPSTYKYLLQNELKEDMKFNKEWKKMYVALTRTRDQLVFVIDHDIFKSLNIKDVVNNIEKMGICNYVTVLEIQNQGQNNLIK